MSIYLIRHTTPLIEKGICYGQSDIDVTDTFHTEASVIKTVLPDSFEKIYSSPLLRCRKLAEHLFPGQPIQFDTHLQEIHCGEWELQHWDDIPRDSIDPWMKDFVNVCIPGGESYIQLFDRVIKSFQNIAAGPKPVAIIAHGGVLRSILAHITGTALKDSFGVFGLHYGCVVRIDEKDGQLNHELLSNSTHEKEQHKPSYF